MSSAAASLSGKGEGNHASTLKRSNPTADDEDPSIPKKVRPNRKKVAMMVMYSGKGYHGLQIQNTGVATIESEIVKALVTNSLVEEAEAKDMKSHMRLSDTDPVVQMNKSLPPDIKVVSITKVTKGFDAQHMCSHRIYEYLTPTFAFSPIDLPTTEQYRITESVLQKVNQTLQTFKGTHNFFNFTSRRNPADKSNMRYMMSLEVGTPFVKDDAEYLVIRIKGQSFMLHQIRKMIGLTIAVVRGIASDDVFDICWAPVRVDIPKAPGNGLLLDKLVYTDYNNRYGNDGIHEHLDWSKYQEDIEKFKHDYIYSDMMKVEKEEKSMFNWLQTLTLHSFQMDLEAKNSELKAGKNDETEKDTKVQSDSNEASETQDGNSQHAGIQSISSNESAGNEETLGNTSSGMPDNIAQT